MSNQYLVLDDAVREVHLVKRGDGMFEDALSGAVFTCDQVERSGLFGDRKIAYQALIARTATPGMFPPFGSYTKSSLA